jgi:hypothetical protein
MSSMGPNPILLSFVTSISNVCISIGYLLKILALKKMSCLVPQPIQLL